MSKSVFARAMGLVLAAILFPSCASLHPASQPTRAQTEDEKAIIYAFTLYGLYCNLGGGRLPETPEEPKEKPKNFIEGLFSDFGEFVREEFRNTMDDTVMAQQTHILEHLLALFGTDPAAELGVSITAKTLEIAYPPSFSRTPSKNGRIDCFPVDPSDSQNDLQAIRRQWGTFAVHTFEDGTLSRPQATLRFDLVLFPTDDSNDDSPSPYVPRYIQPTVLHLTKDPGWKIIAIQTRAGHMPEPRS